MFGLRVRTRRAWLVVVIVAGCGGAGGMRSSGPSEPPAEDRLPPAPPGSLWADGFGPTLREASLDARRAVAEQLDARISSQLDVRETEDSLAGGRRDLSARIKTQSDFGHAELIEVRGEVRQVEGYVVRAYMDRRRAADVIAAEAKGDRERLAGLVPVVEQAVTTADTGKLLRTDAAPGAMLRRIARKDRMVAQLGGAAAPGTSPEGDAAAEQVERRAAEARRKASLRLQVAGDAPPNVRQAAVEAVSRLFGERGCSLTQAPFDAPPDGVPAANVILRLVTRDGQEAGVQWRYLGLELEATDARTGQSFFRFSALPELAKGGGKGWDQADRGLVKALDEKLPERAAAAFEGLSCR